VITPPLEHDPHFRTIGWIRTERGSTLIRRAHRSTRLRSLVRSSIAVAGISQKHDENEIHHSIPLLRIECEQRPVECSAELPLLVRVDGSIWKALEQTLRLDGKLSGIDARGAERGVVFQ
jgi:hypothetical protein